MGPCLTWEIKALKVTIRDKIDGRNIGTLNKGTHINGEAYGRWLKHKRGWSKIVNSKGVALMETITQQKEVDSPLSEHRDLSCMAGIPTPRQLIGKIFCV